MPDVIQIAIQAIDSASKVIGGVGDSLDKLSKQSDDADKKLKLFGLSTDQIGAKMTQAGKIATVGLTLPIAGLAVAATKAASDLNETSNKIQTLFGNATDAVMKFAETSASALGMSKKQALDAAADFAIFGKAAGLAGNDLAEFSKKNVTLAADMASFFNTSPEEAITAIGAAFRGESEPIRRYGVLINEASLKDQALRLGLIKTTTEALQPQQRVLAAQALIMQQTSAAQGDFAKTSGGLANSTRSLEAEFQNLLTTAGQSLLPVVTNLTKGANDLLKSFNALPQSQKDLIVGFGLMAAAAGPVLTIGGKLVSTFGTLTSVAIDAAGGMVSVGRTIGETAGYLKAAGLSVDSLKFAFQNLKAGGALLGVELAVIVAGLIAIAKYLEQVDAASKATTEDLLKMANSGDWFKQAAASTEILAHGQDRLKVALDGTREKIIASAKDYADYKSSLEATAKAAGYQIDAQGNLTQVTYGSSGAIIKLVQANYLLSESELDASKVSKTQAYGIDLLSSSALRSGDAIREATDASKGYAATSSSVFTGTQEQIGGLKQLVDAYQATGKADKERQEIAAQMIDIMKANNGAIADAYNMAITYTESQRKQADVQAELDKLNQQIAAHGAVRTVTVKNEKLSTEELARAQLQLAAAQEDLAGAQKKGSETDAEFALRVDTIKGKIADYSAKLGEHTAVVGGATKAEQEQKKALEEQIATLQKTDEINRAKGAFESLTKAFRDGLLTQDQYQARAAALNSISGLYTTSALQQATAQEVLMKAFADPASEAWRSQLILNKAAIDGQVESTQKAIEKTDALNKKQAEAPPPRAVAKAEEVEMGGKKYSASVEAAQAQLNFIKANEAAAVSAKKAVEDVSIAQEAASRNAKGATDVIVGGYGAVNAAIDATKQRNAEMSDAAIKAAQARSAADEAASREMKGNAERVAGAYKSIPKTIVPPVVTPKIDTTIAAKDIQAFTTDKVGAIPKEKTTVIKADTVTATKNTNDILKLFGVIPAKKLTVVDVDGKVALQTTDDIIRELGKIIDKTITITVNYKTSGPPPAGLQFGGSYIVPPNPTGRMGDYFPILAAPGERVTVQTKAQQHETRPGAVVAGDTYIYNTNVYNPLAAAMLADKQRRDRLARSNARMGVQA